MANQSAEAVEEHFELTSEKEMAVDDVWILLFARMAQLCVDPR
jgi:hypothetical protein